MKQDYDRFESYYTYENDESMRGRRNNQGILEFITTEHYMKKTIPEHSDILDVSAGCGVYAFFLSDLGHSVTAGDFVKHNVNQMIDRSEKEQKLAEIYQGSATDLSRFQSESFDVVLNMGAYYHITDKEEREKSISECLRVLKPDGLFFLAYLNRYSNIIKYHTQWLDDFDMIEKIHNRGFFSDDSLFYTSYPEEVECVLSEFHVKILHNIATDGFKCTITDTINAMNEALFRRYVQYHLQVCEMKSLLGYSEHALVICKK